jgi:transcriptional regulator of acetoin/glycerol metabolism
VIHLGDLPPAISQLQKTIPPGNGSGADVIVSMSELERQTILNTIAQLNGDKLKAARLLGIGKTTLYRKLKEYSLRS